LLALLTLLVLVDAAPRCSLARRAFFFSLGACFGAFLAVAVAVAVSLAVAVAVAVSLAVALVLAVVLAVAVRRGSAKVLRALGARLEDPASAEPETGFPEAFLRTRQNFTKTSFTHDSRIKMHEIR
jgi:uncharacterized membrane protein